jgi:hypothetical protein
LSNPPRRNFGFHVNKPSLSLGKKKSANQSDKQRRMRKEKQQSSKSLCVQEIRRKKRRINSNFSPPVVFSHQLVKQSKRIKHTLQTNNQA